MTRRTSPLPKDWHHIRRAVLERDGHQCVTCGNPGNEVDHIDDPTNHHPSNLRTLCHPCHAHRTALQANAARWANSTTRRPAERHPGLR